MGKSGLKAIANIPRSLRIQIHTRMIHVLFILIQIVSLCNYFKKNEIDTTPYL